MPTDLQTILKLCVPVIVRIGHCTKPMEDILSLGPGAILELEKSVEEELDLLINNKPLGQGVAVKVGENFGIRITSVGPPVERIEALRVGRE